MCDIAPFGMRCEYEDCDTLLCLTHRVNFALTELKQAFPLIGKYVDSYHCPEFTPKIKPNPNFIPPPTKKATPTYDAPTMPKTKPIKEEKPMEFVKAMEIRNRICEASKRQNKICYCEDCPLSSGSNGVGVPCGEFIHKNPELAEPTLEQWNKEHPVQTRADKLRELCPNAMLIDDVVPVVCPLYLNSDFQCKANDAPKDSETICIKCRRDFWTAEYEPPKKE